MIGKISKLKKKSNPTISSAIISPEQSPKPTSHIFLRIVFHDLDITKMMKFELSETPGSIIERLIKRHNIEDASEDEYSLFIPRNECPPDGGIWMESDASLGSYSLLNKDIIIFRKKMSSSPQGPPGKGVTDVLATRLNPRKGTWASKLDVPNDLVRSVSSEELQVESPREPEERNQTEDEVVAEKIFLEIPASSHHFVHEIDLENDETQKKNKIQKYLKKFLVRRPSKHTLARAQIIQSAKGNELDNQPIPLNFDVIKKICEALKANALNVEGIFRVSGSNIEISELLQKLQHVDQVQKLDFDMLSKKKPHLLASAFKRYFRDELFQPLIPYSAFKELSQTQKLMVDDSSQIMVLRRQVIKLPQLSRTILLYLLQFLMVVSEHEEFNKMNIHNLAVVMGPTFLREESYGMDILCGMETQVKLLESLLTYYALFDPEMNAQESENESGSPEEDGGLLSIEEESNADQELIEREELKQFEDLNSLPPPPSFNFDDFGQTVPVEIRSMGNAPCDGKEHKKLSLLQAENILCEIVETSHIKSQEYADLLRNFGDDFVVHVGELPPESLVTLLIALGKFALKGIVNSTLE